MTAVRWGIVAQDDLSSRLSDLGRSLDSIEAVADLEKLRAEIAVLEEQVAAPDLWDDQDNAQRVTSQLSAKQGEVDRMVGLRTRLDDATLMLEMAEEEDDTDTVAEVTREISKLAKDVEALEVRTLLSGEYDPRDALITIRAEAGGVDAADFAEMLMRMYLRWAERNGYPTAVLDTSYAEEAGLKSATFEVKSPYAFGTLAVEAGTHRLVRISPFDNQGRRQTSLRITHLPTGITASCQNEKSQLQNIA